MLAGLEHDVGAAIVADHEDDVALVAMSRAGEFPEIDAAHPAISATVSVPYSFSFAAASEREMAPSGLPHCVL